MHTLNNCKISYNYMFSNDISRTHYTRYPDEFARVCGQVLAQAFWKRWNWKARCVLRTLKGTLYTYRRQSPRRTSIGSARKSRPAPGQVPRATVKAWRRMTISYPPLPSARNRNKGAICSLRENVTVTGVLFLSEGPSSSLLSI